MALLEIREARFDIPTVVENAGSGRLRFTAVVSEGDFINQNNRCYPFDVLWPAFQAANESIGNHPGAVDHPDAYAPASVSDLGIKWTRFWPEGKLILGEGEIIPTAKGRDLAAAIEAGIPVGFSTRGYGETEEREVEGRAVRYMTRYELETVDAVVTPSVKHARVAAFSKEELELKEQELETAQEATRVAETRVAELEQQLSDAVIVREAAETQIAVRDERITSLEARVTELETALESRQDDALEAKLISLTNGHRFAPTIIAQAKALGVNLENAENVVSVLSGVIEGVAASHNGDVADQGTPRGNVSTNEDAATPDENKDELTEAQEEELRGAGLLY